MTSRFDDIQELVMRDARKEYSETTMDLFMNPRNHGPMDQADGLGTVTGPCGDTMNIWIKVEDGRIVNASFTTDGCGTSIASASMATVMAKGKTLVQAGRIEQQDILDALGGLPKESVHCALLASNTLKAAIKEYAARVR